MTGDFEIVHAMRFGDQEIVLGENPAGTGDEWYMCAFCMENGLFAATPGSWSAMTTPNW